MGDTLLGEKGSVMMESVKEVKRKRKNKKGKESRYGNRYGFELKLRCVKLRLEEGLPVSLLSKEVGASKDTVLHWVKAYRERGEAGLRNEVRRSGSRRKLPGPVRKYTKRGIVCQGTIVTNCHNILGLLRGLFHWGFGETLYLGVDCTP